MDGCHAIHTALAAACTLGLLVAVAAAAGEPDQPAGEPPARRAADPKQVEKPAVQPWQKLFTDETWYQQAEGKEQVFRGKLERVPGADMPSTLQRASFYRLKDRRIYTGAQRLEALERLVGREVEVRGKPVELALEGKFLKEIWPAAVRPADPKAAAEPPPLPPHDAKRLAQAELVIRGRAVTAIASPGAKTRQDGVGVLEVLKRPEKLQVPDVVYVEVEAASPGIPKHDCTVYLVAGPQGRWRLLDGNLKTGVSHGVE